MRTGRTGLCLRQTRRRACRSCRFARVSVGRCGIGDNRVYWKTGRRGRLNVGPYILLNLYPVKLKIYLIAKGRLEIFQTAYGACIYLLQTVLS